MRNQSHNRDAESLYCTVMLGIQYETKMKDAQPGGCHDEPL